jgi:hypothetical protein
MVPEVRRRVDPMLDFPDPAFMLGQEPLLGPAIELSVRLVHTPHHLPQWEVRDGVCTFYLDLRSEEGLIPAGKFLQSCHETGRARPHSGGMSIRWHRWPSDESVVHQLYHTTGAPPLPTYLVGHQVVAFYWRSRLDGPCSIVTAGASPSVGHELLHCLRGTFHFAGGKWRTSPQQRTTD